MLEMKSHISSTNFKPNRNMTQLNIGWLDLISVPKDGKSEN